MRRPAAAPVGSRRPGSGGRWLVGALLASALLTPLGGCDRQERDPHTPAGALTALFESYEQRDGRALYDLTSARTRAQIHEAWEGLGELRTLVRDKLPFEARDQAGAAAQLSLLDGAADEVALFSKVASLDTLNAGAGEVFGGRVKTAVVDEAKGEARLTTETGQTFELVREADGLWRSRHFEPVLEKRLGVLRQNLARVREYLAAVQARDARVEQLLTGGPGQDAAAPGSAAGASSGSGAGPGTAATPVQPDGKKTPSVKRKRR